MRSREITLGRKAAGVNVDVDLSLEGPAWKISRKQVLFFFSYCSNPTFFLSFVEHYSICKIYYLFIYIYLVDGEA